MKLKNTTNQKKVVQTKDGPIVIKPNEDETIKDKLDGQYVTKLKKAGLEVVSNETVKPKKDVKSA